MCPSSTGSGYHYIPLPIPRVDGGIAPSTLETAPAPPHIHSAECRPPSAPPPYRPGSCQTGSGPASSPATLPDGSLISYYHRLPLSGLQKTCNIIFTFMSIMSTRLIFLAAHYPANQTPRAIIITCYALMRFSVCCAYFYLFIMLSGDLRCMSFCLSAFFFMCR